MGPPGCQIWFFHDVVVWIACLVLEDRRERRWDPIRLLIGIPNSVAEFWRLDERLVLRGMRRCFTLSSAGAKVMGLPPCLWPRTPSPFSLLAVVAKPRSFLRPLLPIFAFELLQARIVLPI